MSKWVIEYHYKDGDVGVHPLVQDEPMTKLLRYFMSPARSDPSHVIIRRDTDAGQALSTRIHNAAREKSRVQIWENVVIEDPVK